MAYEMKAIETLIIETKEHCETIKAFYPLLKSFIGSYAELNKCNEQFKDVFLRKIRLSVEFNAKIIDAIIKADVEACNLKGSFELTDLIQKYGRKKSLFAINEDRYSRSVDMYKSYHNYRVYRGRVNLLPKDYSPIDLNMCEKAFSLIFSEKEFDHIRGNYQEYIAKANDNIFRMYEMMAAIGRSSNEYDLFDRINRLEGYEIYEEEKKIRLKKEGIFLFCLVMTPLYSLFDLVRKHRYVVLQKYLQLADKEVKNDYFGIINAISDLFLTCEAINKEMQACWSFFYHYSNGISHQFALKSEVFTLGLNGFVENLKGCKYSFESFSDDIKKIICTKKSQQ